MKIGGQAADSPEAIRRLVRWLDVHRRLEILRDRWRPWHAVNRELPLSAQVLDMEDLCAALSGVLDLGRRRTFLREVVLQIPGLPEPPWHEEESLARLEDCILAVGIATENQRLKTECSDVQRKLQKALAVPHLHPKAGEIQAAFEMREDAAYRRAFQQVVEHDQVAQALKLRSALAAQLRGCAPVVAQNLEDGCTDAAWDVRAGDFEGAWHWACARSWLERLSDPHEEARLGQALDLARGRIRNRLKDIAADKAWMHCFARLTEHERQHLVAWSKAVRAIGKGTGKYAPVHRRNAREHLNECRSAIPAWVMPMYRVAETIKPRQDLFDVVIIDEASQSGPEALLLTYLAKKVVVVGDDKQISPTYAGVNHEDVNHLRSRYLGDLPHADVYGVNASFFDLAEIRYQGRIRLREHFRCMPEIIQFSNSLCYQNEPLIPLRQFGGSRLTPVVSAVHVEDGYLVGRGAAVCNPAEATAVVDRIVEMHKDEDYAGKTFGVISLLGDLQARQIETRCSRLLALKRWKRGRWSAGMRTHSRETSGT